MDWIQPVTGRCFNCGEAGHVQADCPASAPVTHPAKPPWCGDCDKQTRLVEWSDRIQRCHNCHPLKFIPLRQHERCGGCQHLRYEWDKAPCGQHLAVL